MKEKKMDMHIWLVLLLAAFLRAMCYLRGVQYIFRTDDFGTLIYPAYLAGYDWSSFVAGLNNYYGYGYYWIFAGLFKVISSPEHLLIAIIAINSILIVLSSALGYHVLVTYMNMPRKMFTVLLAVLPTLFVGDVSSTTKLMWYRTDNEIPLYFICWILVFLILKARENIDASMKKRVRLACEAALVIAWSLTVHERAMSLALAVIIIEIFLAVFKRRWLFQPVAFFSTFLVFYRIHKVLRSYVINTFWPVKSVHNTEAFGSLSFWFLKSWTSLKAFLLIFIGNWHSAFVKSFGLVCLGVIIVLAWLVHNFVNLYKRKKNQELLCSENVIEDSFIDPHTLIIMIFGLAVTIVIVGLSVRWGSKLYVGLLQHERVYQYKAICYSRYYYSFMGPVVVAVLSFLYEKGKCPKMSALATCVLFLLIEGIFVLRVYPYCQQKDTDKYIIRAINLIVSRAPHQFRISMLIMLLCIGIITASVYVGKKFGIGRCRYFLMLLPAIIILINAKSRALDIDLSDMTFAFKHGTEIRQVLYEVEDSELGLPKEIYMDLSVEKKRIKFTLQFSLKDQIFIHGLPEEDALKEDNFVITSEESDYLCDNGYKCVEIDGYYMYTNCDEHMQLLQSCVEP